jgi:hypothetical protein
MIARLTAMGMLLALCPPALAMPAATMEFGAVARGFFSAHGRFGNFYGMETRLMRSGPIFLGVSGFGGPVLNAPRSGLGFGGGVAGAETTLGPFHLAPRLWVGGGGGVLEGQRIGALSLEPSLSIGGKLSETVTGSFSLGYLHMIGVQDLRGLVIAFRADL